MKKFEQENTKENLEDDGAFRPNFDDSEEEEEQPQTQLGMKRGRNMMETDEPKEESKEVTGEGEAEENGMQLEGKVVELWFSYEVGNDPRRLKTTCY